MENVPGVNKITSIDTDTHEKEEACDIKVEELFASPEALEDAEEEQEAHTQDVEEDKEARETQDNIEPQRRYPLRERRPPRLFPSEEYIYSCIAEKHNVQDPMTRSEALNSHDSSNWKRAMEEEIKSLQDNDTWTLVDLPANKNIVDCKWVFKTKRGNDPTQRKYKARLVAKGYTQFMA